METALSSIKFGQLVYPGKITSTLPLKETTVSCQITGLTAQTSVTQLFTNPMDEPAELEYLFPLPHRAALVDFEIKIAERLVKAELQELEQAQKAYEQASQAGQHAALLEQHRPNLFVIRLANVLPGELIQAKISYDEHLLLRDGEVEFVFPMGLTPRYTSPSAPEEGDGINPPVALSGEPVGPVKLRLTLDLGVAVGQPHSSSHPIQAEKGTFNRWQVLLAAPTIPDHDFILRIPTIGIDLELAAWCSQDADGETISVNWLPSAALQSDLVPQPRDFIFVVDRSGSMSGEPIRQARNALRACLRILEPGDCFRILLFDDRLDWYRTGASHVSQSEIEQADAFLNSVEGRGGTEIIPAIEAALSTPVAEGKVRYILFLTDGAVSAEERALNTLRKKAHQARIFTFGIGPSVNRALLSNLARIGRGAAEFLQLDEDIEGAILRFQDKIAFPMLTELNLEWSGSQAWDIYPELLPDLYAGDALEFVARLSRNASGAAQVVLSGKRGKASIRIPLAIPAAVENQAAITRAWARARVDALLDQIQSGKNVAHQVRQEIIQLAIEHHLLTPFTAFVAIDTQVVNAQGKTVPIQIAQPIPKGLDWSGFIQPPQFSAQALRMAFMPSPAPKMLNQRTPRSFSEAAAFGYQEDLNLSSPSISESLDVQARMANTPQDSEIVLRGLARIQNLDGSWQEDVEITAAALLAFLRHGHTTKTGKFRKQVQKALQWLEKTPVGGLPGFARVLALAELAEADLNDPLNQYVETTLKQLPEPVGLFEKAVLASLTQSVRLPRAPSQCSDLDELRLASALKIHPEVVFPIRTANPTELSLVWWATLA